MNFPRRNFRICSLSYVSARCHLLFFSKIIFLSFNFIFLRYSIFETRWKNLNVLVFSHKKINFTSHPGEALRRLPIVGCVSHFLMNCGDHVWKFNCRHHHFDWCSNQSSGCSPWRWRGPPIPPVKKGSLPPTLNSNCSWISKCETSFFFFISTKSELNFFHHQGVQKSTKSFNFCNFYFKVPKVFSIFFHSILFSHQLVFHRTKLTLLLLFLKNCFELGNEISCQIPPMTRL